MWRMDSSRMLPVFFIRLQPDYVLTDHHSDWSRTDKADGGTMLREYGLKAENLFILLQRPSHTFSIPQDSYTFIKTLIGTHTWNNESAETSSAR